MVWVGGIRISTTTTSGLASRTSASSSTALPTWPTTVNPDRSSRLAKPSRSRVSSSATTARSGAGAVPASAVLVSVLNASSSQVACLRNHLAPPGIRFPAITHTGWAPAATTVGTGDGMVS